MATEPVLLSPERIQEIVYRKRRHDLGFATGDEKMCVANAVRLIRDDLPDLLDHLAALTSARDAAIQRAETAERARDLHATTAYESGYAAAVAEMEQRLAKLETGMQEVLVLARAKLGGG